MAEKKNIAHLNIFIGDKEKGGGFICRKSGDWFGTEKAWDKYVCSAIRK